MQPFTRKSLKNTKPVLRKRGLSLRRCVEKLNSTSWTFRAICEWSLTLWENSSLRRCICLSKRPWRWSIPIQSTCSNFLSKSSYWRETKVINRNKSMNASILNLTRSSLSNTWTIRVSLSRQCTMISWALTKTFSRQITSSKSTCRLRYWTLYMMRPKLPCLEISSERS